jgi:hypothetical protein
MPKILLQLDLNAFSSSDFWRIIWALDLSVRIPVELRTTTSSKSLSRERLDLK